MKALVLLIGILVSFKVSSADIISHRGNVCNLKENSVEAVRKVWALENIDGVEIDVRISSDYVVYLYHDDEVNDLRVKDLEYSEVVAEVGVNSAPTLKTALVNAKKGYYIIDLKSPWRGKEVHLVNVVTHSDIASDRIVFQSSDLSVLGNIKQALPNSRFFYLAKLKRRFPFFKAPKPEHVLSKVGSYQIDGVSLKDRKFLSRVYIDTLRSSGLEVFVWTINDFSRFEYYRSLGVEGVITDSSLKFSSSLNAGTLDPKCYAGPALLARPRNRPYMMFPGWPSRPSARSFVSGLPFPSVTRTFVRGLRFAPAPLHQTSRFRSCHSLVVNNLVQLPRMYIGIQQYHIRTQAKRVRQNGNNI